MRDHVIPVAAAYSKLMKLATGNSVVWLANQTRNSVS